MRGCYNNNSKSLLVWRYSVTDLCSVFGTLACVDHSKGPQAKKGWGDGCWLRLILPSIHAGIQIMDRGLYRHFTIMEGGLFNKSVRTSIGSPKSGCQSLSFKIIVKDNPSKHILSFPCLRAYLSYCNKKRNILQVSYKYIIRIKKNDFRYKRVITVTCFLCQSVKSETANYFSSGCE